MPDSQPQEPRNPGRAGAAAEGGTLVLSGARLADGRTVDVRVSGGRIEAVGTAGSLSAPRRPGPPPHAPGADHARGAGDGRGAGDARGLGDGRCAESGRAAGDGRDTAARAGSTRIDLDGYLLLPAPAEPHAHHDSALTACPPHGDAPRRPPSQEPSEVQRRTTEAALLQLGHGATAIRTHVRVGDVTALRSLEAVLAARRALQGLTDLTPVAVPRLLTGCAGADTLAMLRDAVGMGVGVVGGCPDLDPDPAGYTETVLELAAEHGCAVDLHTTADDPARLARFTAMAGGLRTGVTVGPCGGLARMPRELAERLAARLAAAGVTVVALPQGGCGFTGPSPGGGWAPVRLLRAAGVRLAAGSGALRDAANPVGRGDPLEAAFLLASRGETSPEEAYDTVSAHARAALGLPPVRVEAGFPAELLAVRGQTVPGVLSLAYSRVVVHRGRVVARTSAVREFCDAAGPAALGLPRQAQG
ncbi:hydrolase [Streptomyces sp. TRM 70351]|uniref:hydrolase n=1 Tax=Streptomyces sp. TRM 70351 TaxID=3116552 RepID=UPI002E7AC162|nr:hydrolase [Streptomyces sp. TRM 70351]MEE1930932.1 hydrolase [Streptomyces sp. TRM 70351]